MITLSKQRIQDRWRIMNKKDHSSRVCVAGSKRNIFHRYIMMMINCPFRINHRKSACAKPTKPHWL